MADGPEIRVNVSTKADTAGLKDVGKEMSGFSLKTADAVKQIKQFAYQTHGLIRLKPVILLLKNPITAVALAVGMATKAFMDWKKAIDEVVAKQKELAAAAKRPEHYWSAIYNGVLTLKQYNRSLQEVLDKTEQERQSIDKTLTIQKERLDAEEQIAKARKEASDASADEAKSESERVRLKAKSEEEELQRAHTVANVSRSNSD